MFYALLPQYVINVIPHGHHEPANRMTPARLSCYYVHQLILIFIIGIRPLGRSGQRPEFSQATDMALVRCILGKFLGVDCHCFPPLFRCSHFSLPGTSTSATKWEIPSGGSGNCGRECCAVISPKWRLPRHLRIFYMPQIYDMGPTDFFRP